MSSGRGNRSRGARARGWTILSIGETAITLDPSWLIIFVIIAWMTETVIPLRLRESAAQAGLPVPPLGPQASYWAGGLLASVVFFASIVAHEVAHALMAVRRGIAVPRIRLFVFGGVAEISQEPRAAGQEFAIAIVGPLTSAAIGGLFLVLAQALPAATVPRVTAQWLGEINLFLAAFNLLPGFPLDGGRVLRAIVWGITQNVHTATRVASLAGAGFGILLIVFGVVQFVAFRASGVQALWAVFIGWFLLSAARSALREGALRRRLSSMVARDVTRAFTQAPFAHDAVVGDVEAIAGAENAPPVWPVADAGGDVYAMVATRDIAAVPPILRTTTRVGDVAREIDPADVLEPDTPLDDVLQDAQHRQRGYYVVNAGGRVAGWVYVGDLLRAGRPRGSRPSDSG